MQLFEEMTSIFEDVSAKDIAIKTGSNLMVNGVNVFREFSAAYTNYFAKHYEQFGKDIGSALALVFIGKDQLETETGKKLRDIIDAEVFNQEDKLSEDTEEAYREEL